MSTSIGPAGGLQPLPASDEPTFPIWTLLPFVVITFGITWSILALYIFRPEAMADRFGQLSGRHPFFYLAVYAPAIAALLLVLLRAGPTGIGRFLQRLLWWRCGWWWYAFLILGVPAIFCLGAAIKGNLLTDGLSFTSWGALAVASLMMLIKGPVEELGWRGYALPLLQRRMAPIWAGLLVGVVWGVWHLPAFLLGGTPQSAWSFTPFLVGSIALSVIVTPLFNQSRGSILLPALFHYQLINPLWPDAQPYDTYLFVAVAIIVVALHHRTMFTRTRATTHILAAPA